MPKAPRGRKPKQKRNITGLRNQHQITPDALQEPVLAVGDAVIEAHDDIASEELTSAWTDEPDKDWDPLLEFDSLKPCWAKEEDEADAQGTDDEIAEDMEIMADGWDAADDTDDERAESRYVRLMKLAIANQDDPRDEDWIPVELRKKYKRIGRPTTYHKGPDVGSKSKRTKRRYRVLLQGQTSLDGFGFTRRADVESGTDSSSEDLRSATNSDVELLLSNVEMKSDHSSGFDSEERVKFTSLNDGGDDDINVRRESITPPPLSFDLPSDMDVIVREESVTPPPLCFDADEVQRAGDTTSIEGDTVRMREESVTPPPLHFDADNPSEQIPPWEDELHESLVAKPEIRPWSELRDQLRKDLQKKGLTLPQINQLMILRNFATLRLKGNKKIEASLKIAEQWYEKSGSQIHFSRRVRALARHYQMFEQLPVERRGGSKNTNSLLKDEAVHTAARSWLSEQIVGSVTPLIFAHNLNNKILPEMGIIPSKPLCERTARRWLVKLGWTRSVIRKGVYMDGHERADVVQYRETVFLPKIGEFERRMAKYDGPELKRTEPQLMPGEREIIAEWQDETCFQQYDFITSAWLRKGQQVLRKKGRGRLIHVSDFVEEVNGRLVVRNSNGDITREARKVIFPGSNGDPYWDCLQLIEQVKTLAIPTFEEAHPGCQALFIFDQSSAHAALPPDALKAFEMNKSNGGKQRQQKDTIIPDTNPDPRFRGQVQKMTTESGEAKGLQVTLEERGFDVRGLKAKCSPVCPWENDACCMARLLSKQDDFANQVSMLETLIRDAGHECMFLPKFHCELNPIEMYWGWAKYRYRQVPKKSFDDSKCAALDALNACPANVIRRFVNRSWRFLYAYRFGLKGKAAEWAVRKYKGHRTISRGALMHLEALVQGTGAS